MRSIVRSGAVLVTLTLAGCGYAKQADVNTQIAAVRADMEAGDQAVSQEVTSLDSRVDANTQRLQALERDLAALRNEFSVQIERLQGELEGLLAFNVPVHFEFDESAVRNSDLEVLDRVAAVMRQYYPSSTITVEGFADPAGSAAYNERLGLARAEAVKAYLVQQGLSSELLRTVSYGESRERLVAPNAAGRTPEAMANRRVVLVVDLFTGGNSTSD